jgi:hypothetical protein
MDEETITVSPIVFKVGIAILVIVYCLNVPLYFYRRNTFPIKQRLPLLVTVEQSFSFIVGLATLISGGYPNSVSCWNYSLITLLFYDTAVLTISFRVAFLFLLDFNTKLLVRDQPKFIALNKSLRRVLDDENQNSPRPIMSTNPVFKALECVIIFFLKFFNIFQVVTLAIAPACIGVFVDAVIVISSRENTLSLNAVDVVCYDEVHLTSSKVKLAIFGYLFSLLIVALASILRMNDRLGIGTELRGLGFPGIVLLFLLSVLQNRQVFQKTKYIWGILEALFFIPLMILVQFSYPLYLSWKHEKHEAKEGHRQLKSPTRLQSTASRESTIRLSLFIELTWFLKHKEARSLFLQFLESEFSVENLLFYESTSKALDSLEKVKTVIDTFVSFSSPSAVNLSGRVREKILKTVENLERNGDDNKIPEDLFADAREEVFSLLAKDAFHRFRMTSPYKKLVADLPDESSYFQLE